MPAPIITRNPSASQFSLDLLSTRQKAGWGIERGQVSSDLEDEMDEELLISRFLQDEKCSNGAPFLCWQDNLGEWHISQGSCNAWVCPRCGQIRARREYARMVLGAQQLEERGVRLFFMTFTCRGREMSLEAAEVGFYKWCNRLLSSMRARSKRQGMAWFYAGVTERQKRGHPHAHLLCSFCPDDADRFDKGALLPNGLVAKHSCLFSRWFVARNVSAGLGRMCDLSEVESAQGAATYLSKYFFKDALHTPWPQGWRRVRYSNSWPKLPGESSSDAFAVVNLSDWRKVALLDVPVYAETKIELNAAYARLIVNVVPISSYGTLPRSRPKSRAVGVS